MRAPIFPFAVSWRRTAPVARSIIAIALADVASPYIIISNGIIVFGGLSIQIIWIFRLSGGRDRAVDRSRVNYLLWTGSVAVITMGMEIAFRAGELVFLRTPGASALLTLRPVEGPVDPEAGGMQHFGFKIAPEDFGAALEEVRAAGVTVESPGNFGRGREPYAYIKDPDGYTIELS